MFVKWAIIKLLITMHLAMPADIFTKAVDLMTNIPWVYRILSESRPPSGKRGRGAQTSSSNTEPVLETAHEDAERDDEHLVGNTAKLTRLVEALNEHSRAWREVMNKEGDVPEAVGMLCQSDLRRRL